MRLPSSRRAWCQGVVVGLQKRKLVEKVEKKIKKIKHTSEHSDAVHESARGTATWCMRPRGVLRGGACSGEGYHDVARGVVRVHHDAISAAARGSTTWRIRLQRHSNTYRGEEHSKAAGAGART